MKTPGPFDPNIRDAVAQEWFGVNYSKPPEYVDFQRYTTKRPHYPLVGQVRKSMDAYTDHLLATTLSSFPEKNNFWKGGEKVPKFQLACFSESLPAGYVFKFLVVNFTEEGQCMILGRTPGKYVAHSFLCFRARLYTVVQEPTF